MSPRLTTPWMSLACLALLVGLCLPTGSQAAEVSIWSGGGRMTVGSGRVATDSRSVSPFQAVEVSGPIDVRIAQGAGEAVRVKADDNLLPLLETVVEASSQGPALKVRWKKGESIRLRGRATVEVDVVKLQSVSSLGSGAVTVGALRTPTLAVSLAGSGDVRLDSLQTDDLTVRLSGSGDVALSGNAQRLKASLAGSGDMSLSGLHADDVSVDIAGSGDASVHARKTLKISIAGSGDVVYSGNPQITHHIAGSGSVVRR